MSRLSIYHIIIIKFYFTIYVIYLNNNVLQFINYIILDILKNIILVKIYFEKILEILEIFGKRIT